MPAKRRTPAKPSGDDKFIKDLFIAGEDGKIYYLTEDEWKKRPVNPKKIHQEVLTSIRLGTVVGALEEPSRSSVVKHKKKMAFDDKDQPVHALGYCYLLNVARIKIFKPHSRLQPSKGAKRAF